MDFVSLQFKDILIQDDQVSTLPDFESADFLIKPKEFRAVDCVGEYRIFDGQYFGGIQGFR